MRRRDFVTLGGAAAAWSLTAYAQQPAKMKRLAMVHPSDPVSYFVPSYHQIYRAFFEELNRLGFVEGKNLVVERYSAEGQPSLYTKLANDVVDTRPDVIFSMSGSLGLVFKAATTTIPIVTNSSDALAQGLVSNLAKPEGNLTGTAVNAGLEIWGKRIGLLKETIPQLSKLCVLAETQKGWEGSFNADVRQAAQAAGAALNAVVFEGKIGDSDYQRVFANFEQDRPDAFVVLSYPVHATHRVTIVELAAKHRLPAMYPYREFVEVGGLMAYSSDLTELFRSTGNQIGQILNGTNPRDIPFNQVTRYELSLNLKTATTLGLQFPATLLGSADFVVE
jgi:putative ABC transport system substrate-binding protein